MKRNLSTLVLLMCLVAPLAAQSPLQPPRDAIRTVITWLQAVLDQPEVVVVPAGAQALHDALAAAQPHTVLQLTEGVYEGNFALAAANTREVVVRGPALLRSPSNAPALTVLPFAAYWRVENVAFQAAAYGDLIRCGSSEQTADQIPHHITFAQVQVLGDEGYGAKRGIALNCNHAAVVNSVIDNIKGVGQDTQGIAVWNAYGPFTITGNTIIAAGENVMFGGSDPSIDGLIPANLLFDNNRLTKPLTWRGTSWTVKNLFEAKALQHAVITNNYFAGLWTPSGQDGFAILLKSTNQDGGQPWAETSDITFAYNRIEQVSAGFKLAGKPERHPAVRAHDLWVHHNLITTDAALRGTGRCAQIMGVANVRFEFNTCTTHGSTTLYLDNEGLNPGLMLIGNILTDRAYGIKGDGTTEGVATLTRFADGFVFEKNLVISTQPGYYSSATNRIEAAMPADVSAYGAGVQQ